MTELQEDRVSLKRLLLDPNNYRYQDLQGFAPADENRYHEDRVQKRASDRLRQNGMIQLKNSLIQNGLLTVERIVVVPYQHLDGYYVVAEGNRRVAALKWIFEDHHEGGISAPDELLESMENIPVIVVKSIEEDPTFLDSLLGVRHVSGIKEWGGYQRAKLVTTLRDDRGLQANEVADRLGMTAHEVNRRYRAFKTLDQMSQDEDFGSYAKPQLYPIFHEAVAQPTVRDWLGWDESLTGFGDPDTTHQFYELITPNESDDDRPRDAKILTREQTRELRGILQDSEAKRVLLDPSRSFMDALSIAKREELSRAWKTKVDEAIDALQRIGALELGQLGSEDVEQLRKLEQVAKQLLETHKRISTRTE